MTFLVRFPRATGAERENLAYTACFTSFFTARCCKPVVAEVDVPAPTVKSYKEQIAGSGGSDPAFSDFIRPTARRVAPALFADAAKLRIFRASGMQSASQVF